MRQIALLPINEIENAALDNGTMVAFAKLQAKRNVLHSLLLASKTMKRGLRHFSANAPMTTAATGVTSEMSMIFVISIRCASQYIRQKASELPSSAR